MSEKAAQRWQFLLEGEAVVTPAVDENGEVEYMMVHTEYSATKCYSPAEVDDAIDIAMFKTNAGVSFYIH